MSQATATVSPFPAWSRVVRLAGVSTLLPWAAIAYACLRVVNLWRPVLVGTLTAKGRISTMIAYIEPRLRELQFSRRAPLLIVINPGPCPNAQLTAMYRRVLWLLDDEHPWLRRIMQVTYRAFVSGSSLDAHLADGYKLKFLRAWNDAKPGLSFTADEAAAGRALLERIGVPPGAPFICWGLREAAYYQQFLTPEAKRRAQYLNTEAEADTYVRNPPLRNYLPMLGECAAQGFHLLRMGQGIEERLPAGLDPRIIDYAANHRTPFGDIYLLAHAAFTVSGGAGLWNIANAFNRPVVWTDSYCLQVRPVKPSDLFIPKLVWVIGEKRLLTFEEMLTAHMRYTYESNCRADGVELLHNTPEEIAAVIREMLARQAGTWRDSDEDAELHRRFDALYRPEHALGYRMPGRIGTQFLRQHADLL